MSDPTMPEFVKYNFEAMQEDDNPASSEHTKNTVFKCRLTVSDTFESDSD